MMDLPFFLYRPTTPLMDPPDADARAELLDTFVSNFDKVPTDKMMTLLDTNIRLRPIEHDPPLIAFGVVSISPSDFVVQTFGILRHDSLDVSYETLEQIYRLPVRDLGVKYIVAYDRRILVLCTRYRANRDKILIVTTDLDRVYQIDREVDGPLLTVCNGILVVDNHREVNLYRILHLGDRLRVERVGVLENPSRLRERTLNLVIPSPGEVGFVRSLDGHGVLYGVGLPDSPEPEPGPESVPPPEFDGPLLSDNPPPVEPPREEEPDTTDYGELDDLFGPAQPPVAKPVAKPVAIKPAEPTPRQHDVRTVIMGRAHVVDAPRDCHRRLREGKIADSGQQHPYPSGPLRLNADLEIKNVDFTQCFDDQRDRITFHIRAPYGTINSVEKIEPIRDTRFQWSQPRRMSAVTDRAPVPSPSTPSRETLLAQFVDHYDQIPTSRMRQLVRDHIPVTLFENFPTIFCALVRLNCFVIQKYVVNHVDTLRLDYELIQRKCQFHRWADQIEGLVAYDDDTFILNVCIKGADDAEGWDGGGYSHALVVVNLHVDKVYLIDAECHHSFYVVNGVLTVFRGKGVNFYRIFRQGPDLRIVQVFTLTYSPQRSVPTPTRGRRGLHVGDDAVYDFDGNGTYRAYQVAPTNAHADAHADTEPDFLQIYNNWDVHTERLEAGLIDTITVMGRANVVTRPDPGCRFLREGKESDLDPALYLVGVDPGYLPAYQARLNSSSVLKFDYSPCMRGSGRDARNTRDVEFDVEVRTPDGGSRTIRTVDQHLGHEESEWWGGSPSRSMACLRTRNPFHAFLVAHLTDLLNDVVPYPGIPVGLVTIITDYC